MFSAKNYGLPKDLIEAAKKVHEKQLMEYDEDGYIKNPPEGMDKGTPEERKRAAEMGLKGPHLEGEGKLPKKNKKLPPLPVKKPKPKTEEVQFTEEELAEAFAIFLEENFHVDMLTEEDLDYVFENEFPQWLEEIAAAGRIEAREEQRKRAAKAAAEAAKEAEAKSKYRSRKDENLKARAAATASTDTPGTSSANVTKPKRWTLEGYHSRLRKQPFYRDATANAVQSDTGGPGETGVGDKIAKAPASTARKPASTARNQVRRPAPEIDYKTPVTKRGPDGTYGLTGKGREYVARKEAQERKKPFSASKFFSQMQRDGN